MTTHTLQLSRAPHCWLSVLSELLRLLLLIAVLSISELRRLLAVNEANVSVELRRPPPKLLIVSSM